MKKVMLTAALAVLLMLSLAQSQGTGIISGVIRSESGQALANVKLDCYLNYQLVTTATSDAQGNFIARGLIPGKYLIHASLEGFELWKRDRVDVKAGRTTLLNLRLKPGVLVPETVSQFVPVTELHIRGGRAAESNVTVMYDLIDGGYRMAVSPSFAPGSTSQYPPNWNTEDYDAITPNIFHSPLTDPLSTFSIDVDTATYSNVRRFLNSGESLWRTPSAPKKSSIISATIIPSPRAPRLFPSTPRWASVPGIKSETWSTSASRAKTSI